MDVTTKVSVPKNSEECEKHPIHVNDVVRPKNGLINGVSATKSCKGAHKKQNKGSKTQLANSVEAIITIKETKKSEDSLTLNQSKTKLNDQKGSKKKSKVVKNGPQQKREVEAGEGLPKLDINSVAPVNLETFMSNMKMISELPSTSHLEVNKSPLLQCGSSDFEKNLIESIKSLKIQNGSETGTKEKNFAEEGETKVQSNEEQEQSICDIQYVQYESELQMPMIMKIIQKDLSEPYSIYTYRYFIHNWPKLCFLAMCDEKCVGAIVCKLDYHKKSIKRGYIAMLAVDKDYRKRKIGSTLVSRAIAQMVEGDADEVVLETEVTNKPALRLYEQLGFVRDKRLFRYYLNGVDALRLKLWLR